MLIKCPECGKEVSNMAPTCPHCGVPIAGHYTSQTANSASTRQQQNEPETQKKSNMWVYILSLIIALGICGGVYYMYINEKTNDEEAQYQLALRSDDAEIMQAFLKNYPDASRAHRDSIQAHLTALTQIDREWNDALISNSRAALKAYIDAHQGSPYEKTALHLIDSMDWASAHSANTAESMKSYIEGHPNGEHIDDANELIRQLNASTVQPEERQMISSIFRTFFQSVNSKDEERLTSTVNSLLTTFLGKTDATKSDVIYFMNKLWKEDIKNLNWRLGNDFNIDKQEVGDGEYEYSVSFSASEAITKLNDTNEQEPLQYRIKAKVNPDGKISEFTMSKVLK